MSRPSRHSRALAKPPVCLLLFLAAGLAPVGSAQEAERDGAAQRLDAAAEPADRDPPPVVDAIPEPPTGFWRRSAPGASIVIEAPVEAVWAYMGDSSKAREWSVFFHHITPLPGTPDGEVGAVRRCFRNADEEGKRWDEVLAGVEPLRRRYVVAHAVQGFRPRPINRETWHVWQVYEPLGPDRTRLTLRSAPRSRGVAGRTLGWLTARRTRRIYRENLANIKAAIEQGADYARVFPFTGRG